MSDKVTLILVNGTFIVLVAASALTWAVVIVKLLQQWRLSRQGQQFETVFEKFAGLPTTQDLERFQGPAARVAQAGIEAWYETAQSAHGRVPELDVRRDLLERHLRRQLQREKRVVEAGLPVLASIGSTAPFVGLFGTVLGIIHALSSIGRSGSASLDVVAGPIGEALVATAIGIGVAVPAVLAYNYFVRRLKTFGADLEDFANRLVGSAIKSFVRLEPVRARSLEDARPLQPEASV
ncbi:MAG: MotA/TolQ/ExbB proton channel family protein [Pseudomonadota bacterium]|jgi:biopolymer transport protein ExbB